MTPEAQRIAIAEACEFSTKKEICGSVYVYRDGRGNMVASLPNYLTDLNAMRDAEETLSAEALLGFDRHLYDAVDCNHQKCIHATAAQRAEAFLKTLNLWKD